MRIKYFMSAALSTRVASTVTLSVPALSSIPSELRSISNQSTPSEFVKLSESLSATQVKTPAVWKYLLTKCKSEFSSWPIDVSSSICLNATKVGYFDSQLVSSLVQNLSPSTDQPDTQENQQALAQLAQILLKVGVNDFSVVSSLFKIFTDNIPNFSTSDALTVLKLAKKMNILDDVLLTIASDKFLTEPENLTVKEIAAAIQIYSSIDSRVCTAVLRKTGKRIQTSTIEDSVHLLASLALARIRDLKIVGSLMDKINKTYSLHPIPSNQVATILQALTRLDIIHGIDLFTQRINHYYGDKSTTSLSFNPSAFDKIRILAYMHQLGRSTQLIQRNFLRGFPDKFQDVPASLVIKAVVNEAGELLVERKDFIRMVCKAFKENQDRLMDYVYLLHFIEDGQAMLEFFDEETLKIMASFNLSETRDVYKGNEKVKEQLLSSGLLKKTLNLLDMEIHIASK
jgi:hypothetical protein